MACGVQGTGPGRTFADAEFPEIDTMPGEMHTRETGQTGNAPRLQKEARSELPSRSGQWGRGAHEREALQRSAVLCRLNQLEGNALEVLRVAGLSIGDNAGNYGGSGRAGESHRAFIDAILWREHMPTEANPL